MSKTIDQWFEEVNEEPIEFHAHMRKVFKDLYSPVKKNRGKVENFLNAVAYAAWESWGGVKLPFVQGLLVIRPVDEKGIRLQVDVCERGNPMVETTHLAMCREFGDQYWGVDWVEFRW